MAHVDEFGSTFHSCKGCFEYGVGFSYKCYYSPVSGRAGVDIEQFHTFDAFDDVGYIFDYSEIASLAEIGHAFDNFLVHERQIKG